MRGPAGKSPSLPPPLARAFPTPTGNQDVQVGLGSGWKEGGQRPECPLRYLPVTQKAGALLEAVLTAGLSSSLPPRMRTLSQQPREGMASQGREKCLLKFPLF